MNLPKLASAQEANEWGNANYPNIKWCLDGLDESLIQTVVEQFHLLAQSFPRVAESLSGYCVGEVLDEPEDRPGLAYYDRDDGVIILNYRFWRDADDLRKKVDVGMLNRFRFFSTNPIGALIAHEFGHAAYELFCGTEEYDEWKNLVPCYVSNYAKENELELFAETFAYCVPLEYRPGYPGRTYQLVVDAMV